MDESVIKHLKPTVRSVSELLLAAADLIEKRGWCQNDYRSEDGRLCLLGAMKTVEDVNMYATTWAVNEAVDRLYREIGERAWVWQDQKGRTQAEVVAKLRAVALAGA